MVNVIGGYGELQFEASDQSFFDNAIALQSARACLYLFLKTVQAKKIYLPDYICDSLYLSLENLNIEVKSYPLTEKLEPTNVVELASGEYFLLVNYFGMSDQIIDKWIFLLDEKKVIVDNSQSIYSKAKDNIATIYSPRKFIGIPDGGFIFSDIELKKPDVFYPGENFCKHLLYRCSDKAEEGYEFYIDAEKALEDFYPKKMSVLSSKIISSIDWSIVKKKRLANFKGLEEKFYSLNEFNFPVDEFVPLCYPLKLDLNVEALHVQLVKEKIFTPRYWPSSIENDWYRNTLFLPIDERLSLTDINRMIDSILNFLRLK